MIKNHFDWTVQALWSTVLLCGGSDSDWKCDTAYWKLFTFMVPSREQSKLITSSKPKTCQNAWTLGRCQASRAHPECNVCRSHSNKRSAETECQTSLKLVFHWSSTAFTFKTWSEKYIHYSYSFSGLLQFTRVGKEILKVNVFVEKRLRNAHFRYIWTRHSSN